MKIPTENTVNFSFSLLSYHELPPPCIANIKRKKMGAGKEQEIEKRSAAELGISFSGGWFACVRWRCRRAEQRKRKELGAEVVSCIFASK